MAADGHLKWPRGVQGGFPGLGVNPSRPRVEAGAAGGGGCAEIQAVGAAKRGTHILGSLGLVDP